MTHLSPRFQPRVGRHPDSCYSARICLAQEMQQEFPLDDEVLKSHDRRLSFETSIDRILSISMNLKRKMKMRKSSVFVAIAGSFAILVGANNAEARQFTARHQGREVVVHTNPVPVILHRLVPPNHGRHITAQEYQQRRSGTLANPSRPSVR